MLSLSCTCVSRYIICELDKKRQITSQILICRSLFGQNHLLFDGSLFTLRINPDPNSSGAFALLHFLCQGHSCYRNLRTRSGAVVNSSSGLGTRSSDLTFCFSIAFAVGSHSYIFLPITFFNLIAFFRSLFHAFYKFL